MMIESIKTTCDLVQWFLKNEPNLVRSMKACDHNFDSDNPNPFHSEGDIFCHSMMVLRELDRTHAPIELKIAGLLHDIGKHMVAERIEETKKVRFFNHESMSAFHSLDIMDKLGLNGSQKSYIFLLLCLHTEPFKVPLNELQNALQDYDLYHSLLKLAEADKNGRFHTKGNTGLDFNFIATPRVERTYDKKVVLMVGLPTSGKSTYLLDKHNESTFVISRDSLLEANSKGSNYNEKWNNADQKEIDRLLQLSYKRAKEYDFKTVYVDMTHMSKKSRRKTLSHFGKDWGKECVVLLPPLTTIKERGSLRGGKVISDEVIHKMMMGFYPPLYGEGFDKIEYRME